MKERKRELTDAAEIRAGVGAKRTAEVPDEMLEDVTGGYTETVGWSAGWEVKCPYCGNETYGTFECWIESEDDCLDGFKCKLCKTVFGIDKWGRIWGDL